MYWLSIETTRGFVPNFIEPTAKDSRFLGAMITVRPVYE
jgi:hypothetical protein